MKGIILFGSLDLKKISGEENRETWCSCIRWRKDNESIILIVTIVVGIAKVAKFKE